MENNTLKSCPFCGSRKIVIERYVTTRARITHFFPNCQDCRCWETCLSEEEAIAVWNRRYDVYADMMNTLCPAPIIDEEDKIKSEFAVM